VVNVAGQAACDAKPTCYTSPKTTYTTYM